MQDFLSYVFENLECQDPPRYTECVAPLEGYHGTCKKHADSILASGKFIKGFGRLGDGVYFYEGESPDGAIEAARLTAIRKHYGDDQGGTEIVIKAKIHASHLLDLESIDNYTFVQRIVRLLNEFRIRYRPLDTYIAHPHFAGYVTVGIAERIDGWSRIDVIRTRFAFGGSPGEHEIGLVVFRPEIIIDPQPVLKQPNDVLRQQEP